MKSTAYAQKPQHLSTSWAQVIVSMQHSQASVLKTELTAVDIGTTTRIRLHVDHDGPDSLAKHWFIKLPSLAWRAKLITALPRLLHTEVRFYNELAAAVPLVLPNCMFAQSQFGRGATLVLADITATGAKTHIPGDSLSLNQAVAVIEHLAKFHAKFWQQVHSDADIQWLAGPTRRLEDRLGTVLAVPLMQRGLKLAGSVVPIHLHQSALRYAKNRQSVMQFLSNAPQTLIHHDCHPGNLFWQATEPGFLDWQLVRMGEGISDIAYFLATSLTPVLRRNHEQELVIRYADALTKAGIADLDKTHLWQRYRAHLCYPFEAMLVTLAIGGMMKLECNLELILRTAAAVSDLDAFSALPV